MVTTQPEFSTFEGSKVMLCDYLKNLNLSHSDVKCILNDLNIKTKLTAYFAAVGSHFFYLHKRVLSTHNEKRAFDFIFSFVDRLGKPKCLLSKWIKTHQSDPELALVIVKKFLSNLNISITKGSDKNISFIAEILD